MGHLLSHPSLCRLHDKTMALSLLGWVAPHSQLSDHLFLNWLSKLCSSFFHTPLCFCQSMLLAFLAFRPCTQGFLCSESFPPLDCWSNSCLYSEASLKVAFSSCLAAMLALIGLATVPSEPWSLGMDVLRVRDCRCNG